jgi:hypothetical protein
MMGSDVNHQDQIHGNMMIQCSSNLLFIIKGMLTVRDLKLTDCTGKHRNKFKTNRLT